MNVLWSFLTKVKCSLIFNQDLGKTIQLIFAWFIWLTKYSTVSNDFNKPLKSIWYYRSKLQKLPSLGFSYEGIDRFRPYLLSRKFSETSELRCRVPEGSILGRLLFLLYFNDMPQAVDCDLFLYADGTCLLYQHKDLDRMSKELKYS